MAKAPRLDIRTHVCPISLDPPERTIRALKELKAECVYFLLPPEKKDASRDEGLDAYEKVVTELKKGKETEKIEIREIHVESGDDFWDLYKFLEYYREIVRNEQNKNLFFNLSSGTKITAIAGMFSCMIWGGKPYYLSKENEIFEVPFFPIRHPKYEHMHILGILSDSSGKIRKWNLVKLLKEDGLIPSQDERGRELTEAATSGRLRAMLDPLANEWKGVEVEANGRKSYIILNEQGELLLKIFGKPERRESVLA
ncbi:MAG: HFX_2341 family transcriptional regulator domain-containing protein [Nitrososphaerales archaeon]